MKAKQLIIPSVFVLVIASLTLGCTGANTPPNSPTPVPTIANIVTDSPIITPTATPLSTDPGITNGSSGDSASAGNATGVTPYADSPGSGTNSS